MADQKIQFAGNSYAHISTATTTAVKANPALFVGLVVNTGAAGTATVYDSLAGSGTVVAVVDTTTAGPNRAYSVSCRIGLTVVTTGTADITVLYL